jgi:hypothetical protein
VDAGWMDGPSTGDRDAGNAVAGSLHTRRPGIVYTVYSFKTTTVLFE